MDHLADTGPDIAEGAAESGDLFAHFCAEQGMTEAQADAHLKEADRLLRFIGGGFRRRISRSSRLTIDGIEDIPDARQLALLAYVSNGPRKQTVEQSRPWLYQVFFRNLVSLNRKRWVRKGVPQREFPQERWEELVDGKEGADPSASAVERELGARIAAAIDALGPAVRVTARMVLLEGRTAEEAAALQDAPIGKIHQHIHRARRGLHDYELYLRGDTDELPPSPAAAAAEEPAVAERRERAEVHLDDMQLRMIRARDGGRYVLSPGAIREFLAEPGLPKEAIDELCGGGSSYVRPEAAAAGDGGA